MLSDTQERGYPDSMRRISTGPNKPVMSSNESTFSDVPAGSIYIVSKTTSVATRLDKPTPVTVEVVAVPLDENTVNEDKPPVEGQRLLLLIAAIYPALVLALYYVLYVVLNAVSSLSHASTN